jgi:hypothetical protein
MLGLMRNVKKFKRNLERVVKYNVIKALEK